MAHNLTIYGIVMSRKTGAMLEGGVQKQHCEDDVKHTFLFASSQIAVAADPDAAAS